jgi:hypothetical protein
MAAGARAKVVFRVETGAAAKDQKMTPERVILRD